MADQGHWFKLWVSALHDPDLSNLPLEDFARWAILGTYVKAHGTEGKLTLTSPARALCALFQVPDFAALRAVFHRLPNVHEEMQKCNGGGETVTIVSLRNWAKYQGDYSTERVRRFREMKRSKRRGEEKRGEEKKKRTTPPASSPELASTNGHIPFKVPDVILGALKRAPRLGAVDGEKFWQAEIRANPTVDYPSEILKAEAWLAANPQRHYRRLSGFLHNWLSRADTEEE